MKLRIFLCALAAAFVAFLAICATWHIRAANVAIEFERAMTTGDYTAADATVWSPRDLQGLVNYANHDTATRVTFSYSAQSLADRLLGNQKGHIYWNANEVDFVASASGVEVTRHIQGRNDVPTWGETIAAWLIAVK
jgi:hypothetical protein